MNSKKFFILICCMAIFFLLTSLADAGRKTRDLVFEDDEEVAETKPDETVVAVKTTIELNRGGEISNVLPITEFKSGDKVKIVYTTSVDAYVYWMSEGSSGSYYMLFPNPKTGMDNFVKKNEENKIPVKGNLKFDDNPGTEKILLVMSPNKIPELEKAAKEAAVKGGKVKDSANQVDSVKKKNQSKRKTRDLVFEDEEDEDAGVTTSSQVSKDINEPFVIGYVLIHK
jgi:Sec-independent protein translocase protein TatA